MIVWIQSHMELVAAILFALLSLSEVLGLNPNIKSNTIFQLVVSLLKKGYDASKKKDVPPAA